jgi:GntR family transcriptional regulator, transcriptional repressor for pyruvate dehydrogenase complex
MVGPFNPLEPVLIRWESYDVSVSDGSAHRSRRGVTEEAIEKIRQRVASGVWGPGTRLPREADLAAQLGVGRSSLREAVRALALVRVLEVRQGDGTYVASLEPNELFEPTRLATPLLHGSTVLQLFEVRRILEPEAAAMAALHADEAVFEQLRHELARMIAAGGDQDEFFEADAAFHDAIGRATGNDVLRSLLQSLMTGTLRARRWRGVADEAALQIAHQEHKRIYDAISTRNAEFARAAMVMHLAESVDWLREHLDATRPVP